MNGFSSIMTPEGTNPSVIASDGGTLKPNKIITSLSVLLVLQVLAAVLLSFSAAQYSPIEPTAPLLSCDFSQIKKVVIKEAIDDRKTSEALLLKGDHGWSLPDYYGAKVPSESVERLFATLKSLKKGFPISTSADSAERFKVGNENFKRAIFLYDNHGETAFYIGTSPNYRTVYVKAPGSNDIYTVELEEYQITGKPSDWMDKNIAELKPADIVGVDMTDFQIRKVNNQWTLTAPNKRQRMHENVVLNLLDPLAHVSVNGIEGEKPGPSIEIDHPSLSYKITLKSGESVSYNFYQPRNSKAEILKMSNNKNYFTVDEWTRRRINAVSLQSLLKSEEEESKKRPDEALKSKESKELKELKQSKQSKDSTDPKDSKTSKTKDRS